MNETKKQILVAIPNVINKIKAINKDHQNKLQGYKFRSIDDVYSACNKILAEEQITIEVNYEIVQNDIIKNEKDKNMKMVVIIGKYKFFAIDGSYIESSSIGEAFDYSDKAFNKAMSMAFKYVLFQTFIIPTEEEKDTEFQDNKIPNKKIQNTFDPDTAKKDIIEKMRPLKDKLNKEQIAYFQTLGLKETYYIEECYKNDLELYNNLIKPKLEVTNEDDKEPDFITADELNKEVENKELPLGVV